MPRKKKSRKQPENQKQQELLQKIYVDIPADYELLAKEILKQQDHLVQAEQQVQEEKKETVNEKVGFLGEIWGILRNECDTQGRLLSK